MDLFNNEVTLLKNTENIPFGDFNFALRHESNELFYILAEEKGNDFIDIYNIDLNNNKKTIIAQHIKIGEGISQLGLDCISMSISTDRKNILFLYRNYGDIYPYNKLMEYTMGDKVIKEIKIDEQSLKEAEGL